MPRTRRESQTKTPSPRNGRRRTAKALPCGGALAVLMCLSIPSWAAASLHQTWLALGPGGQPVVRLVTDQDGCSELRVDGRQVHFAIRARPSPPDFPILMCEARLPVDASDITIDGRRLAPLPLQLEKIVVVGDTGCRVKTGLVQACNDPAAWPFAQIARSAAAWRPDLVIHVGDYFYRDDLCPAGNAGCAGSPTGDTWAAARADFFAPAAPLLAAAPWIFVRGNHEACDRTGEAWFRLLDPRPRPDQCRDRTEPYVVTTGDLAWYVLDSTAADDMHPAAERVADFAAQFAGLAEHDGRRAWLLSHKPVWAFGSLEDGPPGVAPYRTNLTLQAAARRAFPTGVEAVLSGHLHFLELLAFGPGRPPQLVVGHGGALLSPRVAGSLVGLDVDGQRVSASEVLHEYGYLTLERDGQGWRVTPRSPSGNARPCDFRTDNLWCATADRAIRSGR